MSSVSEANSAPLALSPGQQLSAERKKQGLTEREVADKLKITLSKLHNLEKDKFDGFPAQIYLKGYLKNYARLLGVPEQRIISAYQLYAEQLDIQDEYDPAPEYEAVPETSKRPFIIGGVVLILAVCVLLFLQAQPKLSDTASLSPESPNVQALVEAEPAEIPEAIELSTSSPELPLASDQAVESVDEATVEYIEPEAAVVDDAATLVDQAEAITEEVEILASRITAVELVNLSSPPELELAEEVPVTAELASVNDVLDFRFDNSCWIEVRDNTGSLLYSGLENPGTQRQIEGEAPFQVVIGNVAGTALTFNGEAVPLQASPNSRALRMQVGS